MLFWLKMLFRRMHLGALGALPEVFHTRLMCAVHTITYQKQFRHEKCTG